MKTKRFFCFLAAVIMMTAAGPAAASTGDRFIHQPQSGDSQNSSMVQQVILLGRRVYMFLQGDGYCIEIFDLDSGESSVYDLTETVQMMNDQQEDPQETEEKPQEGAEEGQETEEKLPVSESIGFYFVWNGEIYAEVNRTKSLGDVSRADGGYLRKLVLEGEKASLQESGLPKLDWSSMIEQFGTSEYIRYASSTATAGDWLAVSCYDDMGQTMLELFDLNTGENREEEIPDLAEIGPGPDGKLMATQYIWGDSVLLTVFLYDPADGGTEELARFSIDEMSVRSVAWQKETDTLYYVSNGEIFAAPGRDLSSAQSVNDCSVNGSSLAEITEDGFMLIYGSNAVALKNTDPAQRGQISLRLRPFSWTEGMDEAYYAFSAVHGDVSLIREEYGDETALMQSMMNRDGRVDIYVIGMNTNAFGAVMDRGFLADLSGNEKLTSVVQKMYPAFQESVTRDGKLMALPVNIFGDGIGYNQKIWAELGMTDADVPRTWNQLLDLMEELPELLAGTEFRPFSLYTDQMTLRRNLARSMMLDYSLMYPEGRFNSQELQELLERISRLDLDELGVLTEEEMGSISERYAALGGEKEALLTQYAPLTIAGYYDENQALALCFEEGENPIIPVDLTVAFINPFSQHIPEAEAFLEALAEHPGLYASYSLYPDRNEPLRYPDYETERRNIEQYLDQARRNAEKNDPDDAVNWDEIAADYQQQLDNYDRSYWRVGPEEIAAYQKRAELLMPLTWNFWDQLSQEDGGAAFSEIWSAFLKGKKPAAELLSYVDQKVRMMRMEGN